MKIKKLNNIFLFITIFSVSFNSFAQDGGDLNEFVSDTKNDLLVVVGGGLAGAILGLSTLSFVDEPKEHTRNIIMGASLGIIAGVAVVALSQATKHQGLFDAESEAAQEARIYDPKNFNTIARSGWHSSRVAERSNFISSPYSMAVSFTY